MRSLTSWLFTFFFLLSGFGGGVCLADGLIVIDHPVIHPHPIARRVPPPRYLFAPLEVKYHHVSVKVNEQIAVTEIKQSFFNPHNARLEGHYIFPIPKGAQIDKFSMDINGKMMEAELLDAKKARKIYEDIVRRMKDPALLEYAGQGMFKVRIFPIEPRSEKKVVMKYTELLKSENGMLQYRYPLNTEKFSSQPLKEVSVKVEISSSKPIKTIYSPSHEVEIKRSGDREALVGFEASNVKPDTDFHLYFAPQAGDDVGLNLLTYNEGSDAEEGYFLLLASPPVDPGHKNIVAKDIVFVMDTSGSMAQKSKIDQAKKALQFCLKNLNEQDRFEIVRFSTEAEMLFEGLVDVNEKNLAQAEAFVSKLKPIGGTAIEEALSKAISAAKNRSEKDRPYYIVFLTDGKPTIGTIDPAKIVEKAKDEIGYRKMRIFGFGVGIDIDVHLLDKLAEITRGSSQYVLPEEDIEIKLSNFYAKISEPVLSNPKLKFTGAVRAKKLQPAELPDLFKGEQLVALGRYSGKGDAAITLEGTVNGKAHSITYEGTFPERETSHPFISRLWAIRRVGFLLDQIRLHGDNDELREEVVRLARRYSIVTPYTAYLIVEDEEQRRVPMQARALPAISEEKEVRSEVSKLYSSAKKDKSGWAAVDAADSLSALGRASTMGATKKANAYAMRAPEGSGKAINRKAQEALAGQKSRFLAGKSFYQNAGRWVDSSIQDNPKARREKVIFGSEEYFSLLAKHPEMPVWLSVGKSMEVFFDGTVYQIVG